MDTIQSILFENSVYVYIVLATVELVVGFLWWERRAERSGRKFLYALIVPPVLGVVLLMATALVVTDRQQIRRAAQEIVADVSRGNSGALEKYLDKNFVCRYEGRRIERNLVIALIESQKSRYAIDEIEITDASIEVDSAEYATMRATTRMAGREPGLGMGFSGRVEFVLKWVKRQDGWKIHECEEPIVQR